MTKTTEWQAYRSQPNVNQVSVAGENSLLLEFETGEKRLFDVTPFLARGGKYDLLKNESYLKMVRIIDGGLTLGWPDGQEVYPEALFEMSKPA